MYVWTKHIFLTIFSIEALHSVSLLTEYLCTPKHFEMNPLYFKGAFLYHEDLQ